MNMLPQVGLLKVGTLDSLVVSEGSGYSAKWIATYQRVYRE